MLFDVNLTKTLPGLGLVALAASCSVAAPTGPGADPAGCEQLASADQGADDEVAQALRELGGENADADRSGQEAPDGCAADENADFDFLPKPCTLLKPFLEFGEDLMKMGLVFGVEGEGVLGSGSGFAGYDLVFDLYHNQMSVSKYKGVGISTPGLAVGGQVYMGVAFGFEHGVADWDGYFVTAGLEVNALKHIPITSWMPAELSVKATAFATGEDDSGDGIIAPNEILVPPDGVYGLNIGVSAGVSLEIDNFSLLPFSGSVSEGYWEPHNAWIKQFYDYFTTGYFGTDFGSISARLVDHHDGSECPENWPEEQPDKACIIEFGAAGASTLNRALHTARGICSVTGSCALPISWPSTLR